MAYKMPELGKILYAGGMIFMLGSWVTTAVIAGPYFVDMAECAINDHSKPVFAKECQDPNILPAHEDVAEDANTIGLLGMITMWGGASMIANKKEEEALKT